MDMDKAEGEIDMKEMLQGQKDLSKMLKKSKIDYETVNRELYLKYEKAALTTIKKYLSKCSRPVRIKSFMDLMLAAATRSTEQLKRKVKNWTLPTKLMESKLVQKKENLKLTLQKKSEYQTV